MPNIIEQQDLLKGLPDTRLAMLLQNPVGDIPPFLVAAEAQRRQAIRQQFAGSENKESVVDILTKQLANVPQNIGAKTSPTEEVPDLKGILEKNQEIQDQISSQQGKDASQSMASGGIVRRFAGGGVASLAPKGTSYGFSSGIPAQTALGSLARASSVIPQTMGVMPGNIGYQAKPAQPQQQPQPQQMRGGGMVQRYQGAGVVMPLQQRIQSIMEQFGVNEGDALKMIENNPSIAVPKIEGDLGRPFYAPETNTEPAASPLELNIPVFTTSPEQYEKRQRELMREKKYQEMDSYPGYAGNMAGFQRPDMSGMTTEEVMRDLEAQRRQIEMQNNQNTNDPTAQQQPGETPEEFRARMRALLAPPELSDWEKAQKYFEMSQQFFDPAKTTMQSIAGAGQAFAQSAAEEAKAKREAEFNLEKAMLEMDMAESERIRAAQAAEKERTSLSADQQANILVKTQESIQRVIDSKRDQLAKLTSDPMASKLDPTFSTRVASLEKEIARDEQRLINIAGALAALGEQAYGPIAFDTYSLNSGFAR